MRIIHGEKRYIYINSTIMSYTVLYNSALLINDMILFGDTLLNMSVNVKLLSNKINLKKIIFNTVYQYMTYSQTEVTRNTFRGWFPLQQIRMCQITMP